jgi:hypothetical protein
MQVMGHPILGDELYAHKAAYSMSDRLSLHAKELMITHPTENSRLDIYQRWYSFLMLYIKGGFAFCLNDIVELVRTSRLLIDPTQ